MYTENEKPSGLSTLTSLASDDTIIVGDTSDTDEVVKTITKANLVTDLGASFATAAQGSLADSALQPSDIGSTVQGYSAVLDATTASFTTADETKLDGIESGAEVNNISDANATDLTDGGTTTLHNHDSRYYTETETDTLLAGKANTSHTHTASQITDFDTAVAANSAVAANTAKVTNATHSGDMVGATSLTAQPALITGKPSATVASGDLVLIADVNDSNNLKQVTAQAIADLGGGGVTDGDKGDITVSSGGTVWTINNDTIGLDKLSATGTPSASTFLRGDNTWATPSGSGAVDSVNGQTGVVVLDADDIDDTSTTNKFATAAELADIAANTAARHNAVTLAGTPNYITIVGQVITRALIDLTSHVTGRLPFANLSTLSAHQVLGRAGSGTGDAAGITMGNDTILGRAGSGDVDDLSAAQVRTLLGLATVATSGDYNDLINTPAGGSGITRSITVTSGNLTVGASAATDYVVLVAGAHTITLPTAVSNTNLYTIKNNHSANITVDTTSSQTIDGTTSITLAPEESAQIISTNSSWSIV